MVFQCMKDSLEHHYFLDGTVSEKELRRMTPESYDLVTGKK